MLDLFEALLHVSSASESHAHGGRASRCHQSLRWQEPGPESRRPGRRGGYTLMEIVVVLGLAALLLGLAIPPIGRMRTRTALRDGRAAVTRALVEARAGATRFQRTSVVTIDPAAGVLRAAIDTSSGGSATDTLLLGRFEVLGEYGVSLESDRAALCFGVDGVGTVAPACPLTGAEIVLRRGQSADTLLVNIAGRIVR